MLQPFSRALVELYEAAENAEISAFPAEVIRLAGKLVSFDGAVLGMGESSAPDPHGLVIHNAFVHGRDPAILSDYAAVSAVDPMTNKFVAGLPEPLVSSLSSIEPGEGMGALRDFYSRHELKHLLLFGQAGDHQDPARWLVLYRATGDVFDQRACQHVAALWPHVVRSLSINHSRFLQQQSCQHQHLHHKNQHQQGVALINASGVIETAEPLFRQLCELEWPAGFSKKVPEAVSTSWRRGLDYVGTRVKFKIQLRHDDFVVIQAHAIGPLDQLSPAEHIVAGKFAAGQSAKVIANVLGLSVHTVRTQLSQVYGKLDVHDKGELASFLLAHRR